MIQYVEQECTVCLHPVDLHFLQRTLCLADRIVETARPGRYFYKKAVVVRRDGRVNKRIASIQTNAVTACTCVFCDNACIRSKSVDRVFCRQSALNRKATRLDIVLALDVKFRRIQFISFGDQDLRLYDIDACRHFCNGMFHLDTRVHFDEVMISFMVYQEFYSTCTSVVHRLGDLQSVVADVLSLLLCQAERRSKFDHFLVSSLDGTVTFIQMYDVAVTVSQDLHFDMLRTFQIFFNEDIVDTECLLRFTLGTAVLFYHFFLRSYDTHTSSAASGCRLQHNRVSAFICELQSHLFRRYGFCDARDSRHTYAVCHDLGLDLVSEVVHHVIIRSDENQTFFFACLCKFYIFRQEAVTWMNRIHAFCLCQFDDLINSQISIYRGLAPADLIRFIRFRSEQCIFIFF